jgi:ankyrin repeat protein
MAYPITVCNKTYETCAHFLSYIENRINKCKNLDIEKKYWDNLFKNLIRCNETIVKPVIKRLIDAGININLQNNKGFTPLMIASRYSNSCNNQEIVKLLIDSGADINLQNEKGRTALILSSKYANEDSSIETVKLLIDAGADLNIQDVSCVTALMWVSKHFNTDCTVKLLIDAGADLNLQDIDGNTCLTYLVRYSNSLDVIKTVISKNVSINHLTKGFDDYDYNGNSLLHWCAIGIIENTSNYEILTYLETLDIDKTLKNFEGKTYIDYLGLTQCYYASKSCEICYNPDVPMAILNCSCNCGRQCINCAKKINECSYCKTPFRGFKIIRFV